MPVSFVLEPAVVRRDLGCSTLEQDLPRFAGRAPVLVGYRKERVLALFFPKDTWDNPCPSGAPAGELPKPTDPTLPIGCVKLQVSSRSIVEEKVGKIATTKVTRDDLRPTGTPTGLLSNQMDPALPVGRVKLSYSSGGIVEEKV